MTDKHINSILQLQEQRTMLHATLQPFSLGVRDGDKTNFPPLAVTKKGKGGRCSLMWHEKQTSSSIESDPDFFRAVWFCLLILLPLGKPLTATWKQQKAILCCSHFHKNTKQEKKSSPGGRRLCSDKASDSVRRKLENTHTKKRGNQRTQDVVSTHLEQWVRIAKQSNATLLLLGHKQASCAALEEQNVLNIHLLPSYSKSLVSISSLL